MNKTSEPRSFDSYFCWLRCEAAPGSALACLLTERPACLSRVIAAVHQREHKSNETLKKFVLPAGRPLFSFHHRLFHRNQATCSQWTSQTQSLPPLTALKLPQKKDANKNTYIDFKKNLNIARRFLHFFYSWFFRCIDLEVPLKHFFHISMSLNLNCRAI